MLNSFKKYINSINFLLAFIVISSIYISLFFPTTIINTTVLFVFILITFFNFEMKRINIEVIIPLSLFFLMFISVTVFYKKTDSFLLLFRETPLLFLPLSFLFYSIKKEGISNHFFKKKYVLFAIIVALVFLELINLMFVKKVSFSYQWYIKSIGLVHLSSFIAIIFFYKLVEENKKLLDYILLFTLYVLIFLIKDKATIIITTLLLSIYILFYTKEAKKMRMRNLFFILILISNLFFIQTFKNILIDTVKEKKDVSIAHNVIRKELQLGKPISIAEAWKSDKFSPNDFFPGTAFRVYQFRIFLELMQEEKAWLTGFGLNASKALIEKKAKEYNLFLGNEKTEGYQNKNFHNQYIQTFAELGVFGFLILIAMLGINLRNAIKNKDFLHFAFAVLMISLFLTESFLWRQRGVVFFTLLYCLFNIGLPQVKKSIE